MTFGLKQPIIYVTRDIERAFGLPLNSPNYYIISNSTEFAKSFLPSLKNVLLIRENRLLDTRELLDHKETRRFIQKIKNPSILVFKNTIAIEKICRQNDWRLLNPSAALAAKIEEKISQVEWLGELSRFLPPYEIKVAREVNWKGQKFILQFNRAHTGSGTILIENKNQLREIQAKFPKREVRVTKFIDGVMLTNNNVVWGKKVLCGNTNLQITGLTPFTMMPFATIGNDYALPESLLSPKQKKEYLKMAQLIGKKMAQNGWKGLFGIDVMLEKNTGKLYLIEINARQPASTSFESQLQKVKDKNGLTTFMAHLLALLGEKNFSAQLVAIKDGAQITQRVMPTKKNIKLKDLMKNISEFSKAGFGVVFYDNIEAETDWIRMQSKNTVMKTPTELNSRGVQMLAFALSNLQNNKEFKR